MAEITYKGMVTRLDKLTTVEVVSLSGIGGYRASSVRLEAGATWVRAAEAASGNVRYQLSTPHVVADVHGTLSARCASGVCSFVAVGGTTTLFTTDGHRAVTLNRNELLTVASDGALSRVTLLSPDQLAADSWAGFNRRFDPMRLDRDGLAQAAIAGRWRARMTLTQSRGPTGLYAGDTWLRSYEVEVKCDRNPCDVLLDGSKLAFDGTVYRTSHPPESTTCDGKSGENQQSFTLRASKATPQDGVLRATSLTGTVVVRFTPGRGGGCKPTEYTAELSAPPGGGLPVDYPNDAEERLLNLLLFPERTCQRESQLPRGSTAGVTCQPPSGVDSISMFAFRSQAAMREHYDRAIRKSGIKRDYGGCNEPPDVGNGESYYTAGDRRVGRLLCYADGTGRRWIWSTLNRIPAAFVLVRNDGNWRRLYSFWGNSVGS